MDRMFECLNNRQIGPFFGNFIPFLSIFRLISPYKAPFMGKWVIKSPKMAKNGKNGQIWLEFNLYNTFIGIFMSFEIFGKNWPGGSHFLGKKHIFCI